MVGASRARGPARMVSELPIAACKGQIHRVATLCLSDLIDMITLAFASVVGLPEVNVDTKPYCYAKQQTLQSPRYQSHSRILSFVFTVDCCLTIVDTVPLLGGVSCAKGYPDRSIKVTASGFWYFHGQLGHTQRLCQMDGVDSCPSTLLPILSSVFYFISMVRFHQGTWPVFKTTGRMCSSLHRLRNRPVILVFCHMCCV